MKAAVALALVVGCGHAAVSRPPAPPLRDAFPLLALDEPAQCEALLEVPGIHRAIARESP